MNFAALLGHNSGRATPSLRRTPTAQHNETRNLAGFHLLIARSCSDKPSQLCYHPNNLATDELNNIRPWFREFQRIKGAINSGTLLVDGKRISGGGKTYVPRKDIAEFYRSQGDLRPAFFPEKRFLKVLQSRLGAKPVKIEKSDEPVRD